MQIDNIDYVVNSWFIGSYQCLNCHFFIIRFTP